MLIITKFDYLVVCRTLLWYNSVFIFLRSRTSLYLCVLNKVNPNFIILNRLTIISKTFLTKIIIKHFYISGWFISKTIIQNALYFFNPFLDWLDDKIDATISSLAEMNYIIILLYYIYKYLIITSSDMSLNFSLHAQIIKLNRNN